MLKVSDLSFQYTNNQKTTVQNINFTVKEGELLLITGASGCGKSTIMHCLNGLNPTHYGGSLKGEIYYNDIQLTGKKLYDFAKFCGTVFQNPATQFFQTTVKHELAFGAELLGLSSEQIVKKISLCVEKFNIHDLIDRDIFSLSSGELQLVALASVSLLEQPIILLDEPTANLDCEGIERFLNAVKSLKAEKRIIVVVEHRIDYLKGVADQVMVLKDGQMAYYGEVAQLASAEFRNSMGLRDWDVINGKRQLEAIRNNSVNSLSSSNRFFEAVNVSLKLGNKEILKGINFSVNQGDIVAITGKNGAGKSTLSRALCGVFNKCKGEIIYNNSRFKLNAYNSLFGFVSQWADQQLFTDSVYQELESGNLFEDEKELIDLLKDFDLFDLKDRHPHSLSGGEKQRTAIAAIMALNPKFLILDEPTSGMDGKRLNFLCHKIKKLSGQGFTFLVITHDPELIAKSCNKTILLDNGKIVNSVCSKII